MTTTTTITTEQAEKLGNAWTHPRTGTTRYYVSADVWGLKVFPDRDGTVRNVTLDGTRVRSGRDQLQLASLKVWIEDGKVHVDDLGGGSTITADEIVARVTAAAQNL